MLLPGVARVRYADAVARAGPGVTHFAEVNILPPVFVALPTRPGHVKLTFVFKGRAVDGPLVLRGFELAFHRPLTRRGVGRSVFQHVEAVILVFAVIGGEVDVPLAAQEMKFGGPDVLRKHSGSGRHPDCHLLDLGQLGEVFGFPDV